MITLTRCAKLVKLDLDALVVGLAPHARHHALLRSYLFGEHRGHAEVLTMMIRDLRGCLDVGADPCAADRPAPLSFAATRNRPRLASTGGY
jgi:hypothetical protein